MVREMVLCILNETKSILVYTHLYIRNEVIPYSTSGKNILAWRWMQSWNDESVPIKPSGVALRGQGCRPIQKWRSKRRAFVLLDRNEKGKWIELTIAIVGVAWYVGVLSWGHTSVVVLSWLVNVELQYIVVWMDFEGVTYPHLDSEY